MLKNLSYKNDKLKKEIDELVGSSFSFRQRWSMKSIGTPQMLITECSADIAELYGEGNDRRTCVAELRPRGIILRFRRRQDTFGLILPFYRLSFYQNGTVWSFHGEGRFIKAEPLQNGRGLHHFKENLLKLKAEGEQRIEDL